MTSWGKLFKNNQTYKCSAVSLLYWKCDYEPVAYYKFIFLVPI